MSLQLLDMNDWEWTVGNGIFTKSISTVFLTNKIVSTEFQSIESWYKHQTFSFKFNITEFVPPFNN